ncbi:MAG: O-antigen ligase domain-containing protein, partial [Pelagibacteraceae bacterium]|nr:O-antigen ligase domain-containing protein [Pelagibacteraceae bacterium]
MFSNLKILPLIILPIALLISSGFADFIIILSIIFFLGYSVKKKKFNWIKDKYFILLFVFYIYLIINFYFSQSREESMGRAFGFIRFPLFIMSVKYFFLNDFSKINSVIRFWILIIIVVLVDTLIQYYYGKNILGYPVLIMGDQVRLSSFLGKEYKIGGYLLAFSFIIFSYLTFKLFKKSFYNKFLVFFFYLLSLITIYLTGERSNFIIFCLCSIFFIFFLDFKTKYKITSLIFLLIFILFLFKFDPKLKFRFVDNTKDIINYKDLGFVDSVLQTQYGAHYITAYQIFKDHPFIGSGIKTFRVVCEDKKYENYDIPWIKNRCTTHPHNVILEFLSELGIIGTLLFLIFFIYLL